MTTRTATRRDLDAPTMTTRAERRRIERASAHPVRSSVLRGVRAVSLLLAVAVLVASGMTFSFFNRLTSQAGTGASVQQVEGNEAAAGFDGKDMDILMVGVDTRTGTDIPAEDGEGDHLHNTDTIMLIHVPADGRRASVVSFPRDSWVRIPNLGEKSKINSAYAYGWASVKDPGATVQQHKDAAQAWLVQTVNALSGVQIDHFVEVTLAGFRDLTKAVGGVDVNLCAATSDKQYSGADFPAGPQHLDETQALAFVRQRHGLTNDLDRIKRQQYFMAQMLRKVLDRRIGDLLNPAKLGTLVDALAGTISFDRDLDPLMLAEQMRDVAAGNVSFYTLPLGPEPDQMIGGQAVLIPAAEDRLLQFFQSLSAPPAAATSAAAPTSGETSGTAVSQPSGTPSNYPGDAGPSAGATSEPPPNFTADTDQCIN
ncbi:LCP family protein [Cumulibacter manganitolerans]|uniref:LCP family protein n=1 Tax=Cumulibacter manganitolerans TaxID=1884992 RepID=UPI0012980F59|nr:LCP family protein [Cumulibacter manganitolerans]